MSEKESVFKSELERDDKMDNMGKKQAQDENEIDPPALSFNPRAVVWKKDPVETGKGSGDDFQWVCSQCFEQWRQCNGKLKLLTGLDVERQMQKLLKRQIILLAPRHHLSHYYRYGNIQDCRLAWEELTTCIKTKFGKQEDIKVSFCTSLFGELED